MSAPALRYLGLAAAACLGALVGSLGTAHYLGPRSAQMERSLELTLAAQSKLAQVQSDCSKPCAYHCARAQEVLEQPRSPAADPGDSPPSASSQAGGRASPQANWDEVAQAENIIAAAERARRWTAADRERLRELVRKMPTEERHRLLLSVATLLNDGKMEIAADEDPL